MSDMKTKGYQSGEDTGKTQPYHSGVEGTRAYHDTSNKTQAYGGTDKTQGYGLGGEERTDRTEAHHLGVGDRIELNGKAYEISGIISGERATGEAIIYKAKDGEGNLYALKLYYSFRNPKDEPNPEALERIKTIKDPDILKLYDFGTGANKYKDKFCYEVCQYAAGLNLLCIPELKDKYTVDFLNSNVIPEIFKGIRTLHDYKIYHCDLKPENVYYLDEEQTDLIIGDYGSAKTFEEASEKELSYTSTTKGTNFYLAPEQARGIVSEENDYYSFGMILLHLVYPQYVNTESLHKIIERQFARKPVIDFDPRYGRINDLIAGLTLYDITCRWGGDEVKAWLRGEEVEVNYRGQAEARVQPINLGKKAVIRSIEDLTGYIESHTDWHLDLIEDREGYALLLRWVSDLQGLDQKKVFDKMIRTYQQDGEGFLKQAVLRYFSPQRPVQVDMKTYDFWGTTTEGIDSLTKTFFKHLDDIWKITAIGKLKFYLLQLEFALRQMEEAADGKAKHLIRSILERISSTLSLSPKAGFEDCICVFYPKLDDEKLLKLFYAFDENRAFRDLEGKSYKTLEEVGLFFAKKSELFNNKYIILEKRATFSKVNRKDLLGREYVDTLFLIFPEKIKTNIKFISLKVGKNRLFKIEYRYRKSLTDFLLSDGIEKEINEQGGSNQYFEFQKRVHHRIKRIFSGFLQHIGEAHDIFSDNLTNRNTQEFYKQLKSEVLSQYQVQKLVFLPILTGGVALLISYSFHNYINTSYNPIENINYYSPVILYSWLSISLGILPISYLLKKQLANKLSFFYLALCIITFCAGSIWILNRLSNAKRIFDYRYERSLAPFFVSEGGARVLSVNCGAKIDNTDLLTRYKLNNGYTDVRANLLVLDRIKHQVVHTTDSLPQRNLYAKIVPLANIKKYMSDSYYPISISFKTMLARNRRPSAARFGVMIPGYAVFADREVSVHRIPDRSFSDESYVVLSHNPWKNRKNKSLYDNQIIRSDSSASIRHRILRKVQNSAWKMGNENKIDIVFDKRELIVKINNILVLDQSLDPLYWAKIANAFKKRVFLVIEPHAHFKISEIQIGRITGLDVFKSRSVPFLKDDRTVIMMSEKLATTVRKIKLQETQNGNIVGRYVIAAGEKVEILHEYKKKSIIRYKEKIGICEKNALKPIHTEEEETKNASGITGREKYVVINRRAVNIRQGPSTSYQIMGVAKGEEVFEIISESNGWCEIRYKGNVAYVSKKLVRQLQ